MLSKAFDTEDSLASRGHRPWCLCFRMRGRRSKVKYSKKASMDSGFSAVSTFDCSQRSTTEALPSGVTDVPISGTEPPKDGYNRKADWVDYQNREQPSPSSTRRASQRNPGTTSELHLRRLDDFFADLQRNPQRFVTH